jgi:hypothetical protein
MILFVASSMILSWVVTPFYLFLTVPVFSLMAAHGFKDQKCDGNRASNLPATLRKCKTVTLVARERKLRGEAW